MQSDRKAKPKSAGSKGPAATTPAEQVAAMINKLRQAGGNRTRRERDGTQVVLVRPIERVNLILERWHELYEEQSTKGEPRFALLGALRECAESGVPLPDWVAWDIRDAISVFNEKGVSLDKALNVERFGKHAKKSLLIAAQQNAWRLRLEVKYLLSTGAFSSEKAALKSLANTAEFPDSLSGLARMMKLTDAALELNGRILYGVKTNKLKK